MPPAPPSRIAAYARLIRLDRPIGAVLLLWPALWSLWIASDGAPASWLVLVFVLGAFLTRSAGCAINDHADRDLDRKVERTRDRPLAAGHIEPSEALWVAAALASCAGLLSLLLPVESIALVVVAAFLVVTYPYAKRIHSLPQVHLGLAFAMAVPIAASAVHADWPPQWAWLLAALTALWVVGYDTLYAMADRDEDALYGTRSTALLFGGFARTVVGALYAAFLVGLWLLGDELQLGAAWHAALGAASILLAWQLWSVREHNRTTCLRAFRSNGWVGAILWAGLAADGISPGLL